MPLPDQAALRYYDVDRDYQPGLQRGRGRSGGHTPTIELPAAMIAADARDYADMASRRISQPVDTIACRISQIDPRLVPGARINVPGHPGVWAIEEWEWLDRGLELSLRAVPTAGPPGIAMPSDPGRPLPQLDRPATPTVIRAFELPWDGVSPQPCLYVAASSEGIGWRGAALFARTIGDELVPIGHTGRVRATIGTVLAPLAAGKPFQLNRSASLDIQLVADDLTLAGATIGGLAEGANRALVGEEVLQFLTAEALGDGRWRLRGLLRGRGGTEHHIADHQSGETFVLLDQALTAIPPAIVPAGCDAVAALGLGDSEAVLSPIAARGATRRPLPPVHGRLVGSADGSAHLRWTRRARGAWTWDDRVDVPINEQATQWSVRLIAGDSRREWTVSETELVVTAAEMAPAGSSAWFEVSQIGDFDRSEPLIIPITSAN